MRDCATMGERATLIGLTVMATEAVLLLSLFEVAVTVAVQGAVRLEEAGAANRTESPLMLRLPHPEAG